MNFTYLQHACISSFRGEIHLLLTTDFYIEVQEMLLVPRTKTSHGNVTFSRILCSSNCLTSPFGPFPNMYFWEFEGALNVESFVTPPYTLIQHVGKCKSHQALPINELRSLEDEYPLS
jgi:hypothetical protein